MKILSIVCLFFLSSSVVAENRLSLSQSLRLSYLNNHTINVARKELIKAQEKLPQALSASNPNIFGEISTSKIIIDEHPQGIDSEGGDPKKLAIKLEWPIYRGGAISANEKVAESLILAQRFSLLQTEQNVFRSTATAYMNVLRDEGLLKLSQQNQNLIKEQLRSIIDRFNVGHVTRTDVKQAEARLAGIDADVIQLEGKLESSRAKFKQLVGVKPNNLYLADYIPVLPETLEKSLSIAYQNAPSINLLKSLKNAQTFNTKVISAELKPTVSLNASYTETLDPLPGLIDQTSETAIVLAAIFPLFESGSTQSRIRESKLEENRRQFQILETTEELEQNIISTWQTLQTAKAEIQSRLKQVEAFEIAKEGVYIEASEGKRTVLDTLNADQELLDAHVNVLIAQRNEIVATFNMAAIIGLLNPKLMGFEEDKIAF